MTQSALGMGIKAATKMVPGLPDFLQGDPDRPWTEEDLDLIDDYYALSARDDLWTFRQYVDPGLVRGWFPMDLSRHIQRFYTRLLAGCRPKLAIWAPPQHGKSRGLHDGIAWMAGRAPDLRTIFASYSDDLGTTANLYLQRMFDDREKYGRVFPGTLINSSNVVTAVGKPNGRYLRNSSFLEYVGHKGSFRNTTVEGQVSGKSLDIGVIDDPIKGRNEAQSKNTRDKTWNWLTDDYFNRFSEYAGLIMTVTRWHLDDPAGRFVEHFPDAEIVAYQAIYDPTRPVARNIVKDPRRPGEPLFPEFKSLDFLRERQKIYTKASWASLYQQSPIVGGGETFPLDKVRIVPNLPEKREIRRLVRYWDKAGTSGAGAWTCGSLVAEVKRGDMTRWVVLDVVRKQVNAWDRENLIRATAENDKATWGRLTIYVEQEPGSGGLESAERTIANLKGHVAKKDRVTGSKEIRAEPYAAQWQGGNVDLVAAKWNRDFVDEHENFPSGPYKDQVDATAGAFSKLVNGGNYDTTMNWARSL